jgi:hypothetical protein
MTDASRIIVSVRETIHAPPTTVWQLMLEAMRDPAKYVPLLSDVSISNQTKYFNERKSTIRGLGVIHTLNSADPAMMSVVRRLHASHPTFSGSNITIVLPDPTSAQEWDGQSGLEEPTTCVLDFTLSYTAKPGVPLEEVQAARKTIQEVVSHQTEAFKRNAEDFNKVRAN